MKIELRYNGIFLNLFSATKEINDVRNEVMKQDIDELSDLFIIRIEKFTKSYHPMESSSSIFLEQITFNFWNMMYLYYIQKTFKIERSKKSLQDFFNASYRILEFAIFVNSKSLVDIEKIYFNIEKVEICFFKHFSKIKNDVILKKYKDLFFVKKDSTNKKIVLIDNKFTYVPLSKPMPEINKNDLNDTFWFERHFRLDDTQIIKVFDGIGSKGGSGANNYLKANSFVYNDIDIHEYVEDQLYSKFDYEKLQNFEDNIENKHLSYQMPNLLLDKDSQNILNIKVKESYTNSTYKQYLINKAISNNIAKNQRFLSSKLLNFNLFKSLIKTLLNSKEDYIVSLVLLSIFTGIQVKILILIFIKSYKNIIIEEKNFTKLIIKHNDIFARNIIEDEDILIPVSSNKCEIHLPKDISDMATLVKSKIDFLIKKINELNELENKISEEELISKHLEEYINKSELSNFNNINIKSCHKLFYYYYRVFHKETDTRILLLDNLSKTNETRVCYTVQPRRLIYFEFWLNEFYEKLTEKFSVAKDFSLEKHFIGSKKIVKKDAFKNFLLNLTYLNPKDQIERVNLQMIFIRYSLSILLATRDTFDSCNLINFSAKSGLLTIHEKAKSITSSKRLIPLTKRAIKLINEFYKLKKEFGFNSFSPLILEKKDNQVNENELTKTSVSKFIESFKSSSYYEEIKKYVDSVDLNFGRHIFSTKTLTNGFYREYENEFLGHYTNGNSGFGTYSNLDVKNYIEETIEFLEGIENEYFPNYINPEDIK